LFENYMVMECMKKKYNSGSAVSFYYWRNNKGVEVDLLIDKAGKLRPVEMKSSQTFSEDFTKSIKQWNNFSGQKGGYIIFDGDSYFVRSDGFKIMNWRKFFEVIKL